LLLIAASAHAATYYVAPTGVDTAAGTQAAPWRTLQKCASTARTGDTCQVAAGTYRETVQPASNGVTFLAEAGVTVSGADVVGTWTLHQGSIYKAPMNWTLGPGNDQVFVGGQMMNLARWPNTGFDYSHPTWSRAEGISPSSEPEGEVQPWVIRDSHLTHPNGFWVGAEVTTLAPTLFSQAGVVTASAPGRLEYTNLARTQARLDTGTNNGLYQYALSGVLGALDSPGEWYLGQGTLYLWAPGGEDPSRLLVEAKRRMWAFDLSNRSQVTIKGFGIFAASITMNAASSDNVIDGITATYVWHQMRNVPPPAIGQFDAKWGAWMTGIILSGSKNTLKNSTIQYSSANGVYLHGTGQVVDNNTIKDVAYAKVEGGAVSWMGQDPGGGSPGCRDMVVTRNTMVNSGRHGVNAYYCPNFLIAYNDISHWGIQTIDNGAFYTSKGGTSGTLAYNLMHDTEAIGYRFGLYMDATPQNYTIHHNVVWNVSYGINVGEPATNVKLYNNTVWNVQIGFTSPGNLRNVPAYNNLSQKGMVGTDKQNTMEGGDPKFVNAPGGNFQLQQGSPAIDKGRVIQGITDGYGGSAPDIGAYEYGKPAWTAGATSTPGGETPGTIPAAPYNPRLVPQQ
jgi:parallel beta-helix repeat protein